jgi:hypothetical protein
MNGDERRTMLAAVAGAAFALGAAALVVFAREITIGNLMPVPILFAVAGMLWRESSR